MQIIHRSVGEPAEGSLTRYPTYQPMRTCFHISLHVRHELGTCRVVERDCALLSSQDLYLSYLIIERYVVDAVAFS